MHQISYRVLRLVLMTHSVLVCANGQTVLVQVWMESKLERRCHHHAHSLNSNLQPLPSSPSLQPSTFNLWTKKAYSNWLKAILQPILPGLPNGHLKCLNYGVKPDSSINLKLTSHMTYHIPGNIGGH